MSENAKLRALLAEAQEWVPEAQEWPSDPKCDLLARIDAALAEPVGIGCDPPTYACLDCGHAIAGLTLTWSDGEGAKTFCVQCRRNRVTDIAGAVLALVRERDEARAEVERLRGVDCGVTERDGTKTPLCGICLECAFLRGAEAMREAAASCVGSDTALLQTYRSVLEGRIRDLPVPEHKP